MTEDERRTAQQDSHSAAMYTASRTISGLLFLVAYIIALRAYAARELEYVLALLLVYEGAIAIGSLGLPDAVFFFLGRAPDQAAAIVRQTSALLLAATIPVIGFAALAAVVLSAPGANVVDALPWLAVAIVLELPTQPAVNQLIAVGHAGTASLLYTAFAVLRTAAVLAPLVIDIPLVSIPIAIAVLGVARLAAHVIILRALFPLAPGEPWFDRAAMRAIFLFALPVGLAATIGKLNPQIDKYTVKLMLGGEVFTVYSAAALEIPLVTMIPYAVGAVMQIRYVQRFARGDLVGLHALWHATVKKTMIAVLPVAVIIIALAPDLVQLVAPRQFPGAVAPFQIFTALILHRVAAYGPMLQAVNKARVLIRTSILMVVGNLVLTVPLTYLLGKNGAAIATVIANVPAWLLTLSEIGGALGGGVRTALPWRFYLRTLAVTCALGAGLWLVRGHLGDHPAIRLAAGTAIYLGAYAVVGWLTGVLASDDLWFVARYIGIKPRR